MAEITQTRLRYLASSDADKLWRYVDALPYRIEIKSVAFSSKWYCWFIPADSQVNVLSMDLDSL